MRRVMAGPGAAGKAAPAQEAMPAAATVPLPALFGAAAAPIPAAAYVAMPQQVQPLEGKYPEPMVSMQLPPPEAQMLMPEDTGSPSLAINCPFSDQYPFPFAE